MLTDLNATLPALELLEYRTFFFHHFVKKISFTGNVQQITTLRKDGNGVLRCVAIDRIVCSTTVSDLNETTEDVFDLAFDTDEFNGVEEADCASLIQRFLRGFGVDVDFGK